MTTPVKTFTAHITDEYGGEYPQAVVAIRAFSETSQNTGYSENCEEAYKVETEIDAITYKVNYWYSAQTKAQGRRSRPLISDVDGAFSDVLEVDLDQPDVMSILGGSLHPVDKVLQAIKIDLLRRFA